MRLNHLAALSLGILLGCRAETFTSPAPTGIEVVVGPSPTVSIATEMDPPLTVKVVDLEGRPVAGVAVSWRIVDGESTLIPSHDVSDAEGLVTARWKFGSIPGVQRAQIEIVGADPITFATEAEGFKVVQVTAGRSHGCGIDPEGATWCWGGDSIDLGNSAVNGYTLRPTQVADVPLFIEVEAMDDATCGRTTAGAVWCWGHNWLGGLGRGIATPHSAVAAQVPGLPPVRELAAGAFFGCGLAADSTAWCWGDNRYGNAGSVTSDGLAAPVLTSLRFAHLAAGSFHTCGLTAGGQAYCWGPNGAGQLGDTGGDRSAPTTPVGGGQLFVELIPASQATCGRTPSGEIWCWGLGIGTPEMPRSSSNPTPVRIRFSAPVGSIAGGQGWIAGILLGGRLEVLVGGQDALWPSALDAAGVSQISGQESFCAISRGGDVYCTGEIVDQINCSSIPPWGCAPTAAIPLPTGGRVYGYPPFGD